MKWPLKQVAFFLQKQGQGVLKFLKHSEKRVWIGKNKKYHWFHDFFYLNARKATLETFCAKLCVSTKLMQNFLG